MSKRRKTRSMPARVIINLIKLLIIAAIIVVGVNFYVIKSTEDRIAVSLDSPTDEVTTEETTRLKTIEPDCIMVLGASVKVDGTPSKMLKDRLDAAILLYNSGVADKVLLSGDNGQVMYNEVNVMKNYVIAAGIPKEDIFLDHAGFSTYESVYRASYIFQIDSMVVCTQGYHLYRALYGCEKMDIKALGVAADQEIYMGQEQREIREVMARDKDFVKWIFKPQPTFLGEAVPISGSGVISH